MQYQVRTLFDITLTGTKRNFLPSLVPYTDQAGNPIKDYSAWSKSRNQQRNWDTTIQLLGLRFQVVSHTNPIKTPCDLADYGFGSGPGHIWTFICQFESENPFLLQDFLQVPMITGLDECCSINPSHFSMTNIQFQPRID